jgi:hypothetical protein
MESQLENYAGNVKLLGIVWFIYAGFSMLTGLAGLAFVNAFLSGQFSAWMQSQQGQWAHGPMPPMWLVPAILHSAWVFLALRSGLALVAGWGLIEHKQWGRIVAIVAAFLGLLRIPFGTALGIWTLILLLGYRNSSLYEQLRASRS